MDGGDARVGWNVMLRYTVVRDKYIVLLTCFDGRGVSMG